jgi:hypothetical protein
MPLVFGFLVGTACGAFAYTNVGLLSLPIAILPVGGLALYSMRMSEDF